MDHLRQFMNTGPDVTTKTQFNINQQVQRYRKSCDVWLKTSKQNYFSRYRQVYLQSEVKRRGLEQ